MINSSRKTMKTLTEFAAASEDERLFEMANLAPKRTGLPFVVWISPKADAPHDVRVKVSKTPKVHPAELISVAIGPGVHVVGGGTMSAHDLALLKNWVEMNRDMIIKYCDGEIENTEDAITGLQPIQG